VPAPSHAIAPIDCALVSVNWQPGHLERLRDGLGAREVVVTRDPAEIDACLQRADVAIIAGDLDDRHLAAPNLRWVHCDHAGLNKSARPEVFERGLFVTSSSGRSAPALAEHAMLFMLLFAYQYPSFLEAQRRHEWGFPGMDALRGLIGKTVGIIGVGKTGRELAIRAKAFGMRVLGHRRSAQDAEGVDRMYAEARGEGIDELLAESDYVVLATPLSDATHHLISAREFGLMKPSAVIINMARGAVIDTDALLHALRSGQIAGAGLDVFDQEPLPSDSPLWDEPKVLITPHTTPQVPDRNGRSLEMILENARRYRAGEPMVNLLTPADIWTRGVETRSTDF